MRARLLSRLLLLPLAGLSCAVAAQLAASTADYLVEFDANRDGRISLVEYQDHLSEAFRYMDRNGNGVVDLAEFDPAIVGPNTRPISLIRHRERLADVFKRQDVDRNGHLDQRELGAPPR